MSDVPKADATETAAPRSSKRVPRRRRMASEPAPNTTTAAAPVAATSTARIVAATATKELKMDAMDQAKTMFADLNDRAKSHVEKATRAFEDLNAFGKGNVEALVESSRIAARGIEALGQDAVSYAGTSFESTTAAIKTLAATRSPTELMTLQAEFVRQSFDALIAHGSRSTEALLKLGGEIAQPISNRVALASEKMKVAA